MATLTVRNLGEDIVRQLRIRASEHGRSAEAEHREILRVALTDAPDRDAENRQAATRLAEFRHRTAGRGGLSSGELLREARADRLQSLTGADGAS